ncbi:CGNR zinc finger domain-containing protein [Kineococcus arenarius]|uniref:CGNR zinc finger domain-containing protein n=1 Tax=unclassified Kineococcus TaxID=2621656 RepID=UPI003D7D3E84
MVSIMRALTAYLDEGVTLALAAANTLSAHRQGALLKRDDFADEMSALGRRVAEVLHAPDAGKASELLNVLLAEAAAAPVLARDDAGRWRLHLHSAHADQPSRQMVKATAGLAALVDDDEWDAIKQCAAERCDDFFYDHSRNRSRRFCSRTCANRVNARLHRDRTGLGGAAPRS